MNLPNIKDLVKNKTVRFAFYRDGELWYEVPYIVTNDVIKTQADTKYFQFPIPPEDMRGAIFKREDKAILFMRFIRKHIDFLKESMANQHPPVEDRVPPDDGELAKAKQH